MDPGTPTGGEEIQLDEATKAYVSRPPAGVKPKGGILVFHDVFGYNSARTHYLIDELAAQGFLCISPDFFGSELAGVLDNKDVVDITRPWKLFTGGSVMMKRLRVPWANTENKVGELVLPWFKTELGEDAKLFLWGFCWGGWAIMRASAMDGQPFIAGVGCHPSPDAQKLQSDAATTQQLYENAKCPMLFLPAWNDPRWLKNGGSHFKILEDKFPGKCKCVEFNDQMHGFMNRGNIKEEKIKAAYEKGMAEAKQFLEDRLKDCQ